jgi:adenylosuccinate lyase
LTLPLKVNGAEVKVTPVSPLAQAQKLQEINDVVQYMQIANAMGPDGQASTVSVPRVLAFIAERLGIDQNILEQRRRTRTDADAANAASHDAGATASTARCCE